jgi:hypothetical protein
VSTEATALQQRARRFPCRFRYGGCGARPGEYCRTWQGGRSYQVHRERLGQENADWQRRYGRDSPPRRRSAYRAADRQEAS